MSEKVITFHYTLKGPQGNIIDKSEEQEPLAFLTNSGQIIPGLESAIVEMEEGDKTVVNVSAADAYGERSEELMGDAERDQFPKDLEVGQMFAVDEEGMSVVTVLEFDDEKVVLDGNHPLAGLDLTFDVEIIETREATAEEIEHGHSHGEGGVQH